MRPRHPSTITVKSRIDTLELSSIAIPIQLICIKRLLKKSPKAVPMSTQISYHVASTYLDEFTVDAKSNQPLHDCLVARTAVNEQCTVRCDKNAWLV